MPKLNSQGANAKRTAGSQQRVVRRQWSKWITLTANTCNKMAVKADDENSHLADALWGAASSLLNARDILKQMPPNDEPSHSDRTAT